MDERIKELRDRIDGIDDMLVELISERVKLAKEIGRLKRESGVEVFDPGREDEVLANVGARAEADREFIEKIFADIMEYCRNEERK